MQKLKSAAVNVLMFGGTIFYLIIIYSFLTYDDSTRIIRYDCSIAEFHPDVPIEVREACRKIRHVTSV
jgi:hypothetical protein